MNPATFEHTLLHTLAANVPHRIYAKDLEGRFIFANQAVAAGMGVQDPAQLLGRTDFDFYPAEAAREYFAQEQEIMRSGQPMLSREERVSYLLLRQEAWLLTTKVPLRNEHGEVIGLVGINYDITPLKTTEHALREAEEALRRQALHDPLTGLPNRLLLMDRLELAIQQARRNKDSLTLLFLDLDRFKLINDTLGHEAGDELLKAVARRVSDCVRSSDTFARLGGDEFVLLLPNAVPDDVLARLIGRLRHAVADPVTLCGQRVSVTCSIGCSVYPDDGADACTLLRHADSAMYGVKQSGRDDVQRYSAAR
jgi:diguanylate cyclase (GGDEF)-like protein/PAS domain S-box-containing protein